MYGCHDGMGRERVEMEKMLSSGTAHFASKSQIKSRLESVEIWSNGKKRAVPAER
jgi:hypothetical protein